MNRNLLTILAVLFSFYASSQSSKIQTVEIKTEIFCDHCSECESCDQNIYMRIKENTKGVRKVKVDSETNTITVSFNSEKTNVDAIENAIALAGFQANSKVPTEENYEKLDGCCKRK